MILVKTEAKAGSGERPRGDKGWNAGNETQENGLPTAVSTLTRFKSLTSLMSDSTIVLRSLISRLIEPTSCCNVIRIDP